MVVAQLLKPAEITEQESLLLTRNLLRIAIFNISYIRGLFPEKYFNDKNVPALDMKIKKLMPLDAESHRLIDWMEKGVYDALQKKYLRTLLFSICESKEGPIIEEYAFSFSYPNANSQEVCMNFNRTGNKKQGKTFKCNSTNEVTPSQMKSSACKMIRTLVQLMRTLDKMPEERTIMMKLLYNDETPADYEPPFFRCCTDEDARNVWTRNPLKMEVGNVNSKHILLALKVKSVLDPCEDDNEECNDDSVSLGADSVQRDDTSDSDSEVSYTQGNRYIVQPVDKQQPHQEDTIMVSQGSDATQDTVEDENQLSRVKDWMISNAFEAVELTDVLANFPDISVVLIQEILTKLLQEGIVRKVGKDVYSVNMQKNADYEFDVKKEVDDRVPLNGEKSAPNSGEDYLYMKALYHALPMDYVTVSKLQSKLDGDANQTTVKKLINKMAGDGFVEATSTRRLGKRVIHSKAAEKKLLEVKKALDFETMDVEVHAPQSKNLPEIEKSGNTRADVSTVGALHSIGSDITRMHIKSESKVHQREGPYTPTSKNAPAVSSESTIPGSGRTKLNGLNMNCNEADDVICSRPSQDKRSRKASTVTDPIIQFYKRQKSQAVCQDLTPLAPQR